MLPNSFGMDTPASVGMGDKHRHDVGHLSIRTEKYIIHRVVMMSLLPDHIAMLLTTL